MTYRVVLKMVYREAWFDFENSAAACSFLTCAAANLVPNEDGEMVELSLKVINKESED